MDPGPLEREWQGLARQLHEKNRHWNEILTLRITFYLGARTALQASNNPMAVLLMASELRAIDKELRDMIEDIPCPVNIS